MQTENRLLDDLARVASGAIGTLSGLREEIELRVRERLERVAAEMDLVTREEFEAVREMAAKARGEQDDLRARIDALEARLATLEAERGEQPTSGPSRAAKTRKSKDPDGTHTDMD